MEVGDALIRNSEDINALFERVGNLEQGVMGLAEIIMQLMLVIEGKMPAAKLEELGAKAGRIMVQVSRIGSGK